jgi:CopG family nickel-responsive transcriptional regulator
VALFTSEVLSMSLKRFGVSLEDNLLESLDRYVEDNGFANRSQAIRFLVEKNVAEQKWQCNHIVAGTIIIMYDQAKKDIASKITLIQQNYTDVILSSSQYYINRNFCMHIATVMGTAFRLTELSDRLTTIKGIKHGKLVMSRAD